MKFSKLLLVFAVLMGAIAHADQGPNCAAGTGGRWTVAQQGQQGSSGQAPAGDAGDSDAQK